MVRYWKHHTDLSKKKKIYNDLFTLMSFHICMNFFSRKMYLDPMLNPSVIKKYVLLGFA